MKMRLNIICMCLLVIFASLGCNESGIDESYYTYEQKEPIPALHIDSENIATEEMLHELQYAYGYEDLQAFSLYNDDSAVMSDFYFSEEVKYWEIKSAMEFSHKKLHRAVANQMFMRVFDGWIMQNEYYVNGVNETLARIYINNEEVLSYLYREGTLQSEYEDITIYLKARESAENPEKTQAAIMNIERGAQIRWQKAFEDNTGILHITTDKMLNANRYERIRAALLTNLREADNAPWDKLYVALFAGGSVYSEEAIALE